MLQEASNIEAPHLMMTMSDFQASVAHSWAPYCAHVHKLG